MKDWENSAFMHIFLLSVPFLRMNHSCNANAVWSWKANSPFTKEVRAVRDIGLREELCTNYIDSFEVRHQVAFVVTEQD